MTTPARLTIPPLLIDPQTLPPPLLTSEPGSFAHDTLAVRIPKIIEDTLAWNRFPEDINGALEGLRKEILNGRIRGLEENTVDKDFWNTVSSQYIGRSWLDVPWFWAETFCYRRILEATRYFHPGSTFHLDPYRPSKLKELAPDMAPRYIANTLRALPRAAEKRFQVLFHSSLWGNRIDLSYNVSSQVGRGEQIEEERANILVDDSPQVWTWLTSEPPRRLALIADNAGTELVSDLALIDFLLGERVVELVRLHLKPQPMFVSDAMPVDLEDGVEALARGDREARALAEHIWAYLKEGRLVPYHHWLYPTCLFYFQLPDDLLSELLASDLVILKGDANYRRLLGDAHWPPETPFDYVTRYFPTRLVALRTLKAEEIVGLAKGEAEELSRIDKEWMVNGRRGVIQAKLKNPVAIANDFVYNPSKFQPGSNE